MQKISLSNRADFSIAKKSRQSQRPEPLLNHLRVMIRFAEHVLAAPVATAKAAAIDGGVAEVMFRAPEKLVHVLGRCRGGAPLKLHCLAQAW